MPGALLAVAELGVGVQVAAHRDHGRCDPLGGGADRGVGSGWRGGGEGNERGCEDHRWPPVSRRTAIIRGARARASSATSGGRRARATRPEPACRARGDRSAHATSSSTSWPTAAPMRRTWRFLPSVRTISSQVEPAPREDEPQDDRGPCRAPSREPGASSSRRRAAGLPAARAGPRRRERRRRARGRSSARAASGEVSRSPSLWSLVRISRPELSRSSRPTGNTQRGRSPSASYTVGRPPGSTRVVTRPTGLWSAITTRSTSSPTRRPSTVTRSRRGSMRRRGERSTAPADPHAPVRDPALRLAPRADAELRERAGERHRALRLRLQAGPGRSPSANVISPSHASFPSTSARPRRLPILLRIRSTSPSSRTWSPATTGRR